MASPVQSPGLEIRHKSQQSHDSGAYIDWNSEDSGGSPVLDGNAEGSAPFVASNVTGEFVTVVAVESGGNNGHEQEEESSTTIVDATDSFVTVLSIGTEDSAKLSLDVPGAVNEVSQEDEDRIEDVLVYRLPGERLGFGLKFEGGTKTAERVRRLFIQSCAPDSPASRAKCTWGTLQEGDEVLEIDGVPVQNMTRIDCVRCLKESHVVIKLLVRHPAPNTNPYVSEKMCKKKKLGLLINDITPHDTLLTAGDMLSPTKSPGDAPMVISAEMKKSPPPPPPIPPRKLPRKNPPNKDKATAPSPASIVIPPRGFGDGDSFSVDSTAVKRVSPPPASRGVPNEDLGTDSDSSVQKSSVPGSTIKRVAPASPRCSVTLSEQNSPEVSRSSNKRFLGFDITAVPPEAEVYLDLLAQEELNRLNESESDDTGSSISTVVDRLSSVPTTSNSSFSASSTTPSTPTATSTPAIDLAKVLSPFEQLEREFSSAGQLDDDVFQKFTSEDSNLMESSKGTSNDVCANFSLMKCTHVDDESLTLQPPVSFQDAPLSYGDEQVISVLNNDDTECDLDSVSVNECVMEILENGNAIKSYLSEYTEDSKEVHEITGFGKKKGNSEFVEASPEKSALSLSVNDDSSKPILITEFQESECGQQSYEVHEMENKSDVHDVSSRLDVIDVPALPPKPAPRQEPNISGTRFRSGKKRPPPPPPPRSDRPVCPQPENSDNGSTRETKIPEELPDVLKIDYESSTEPRTGDAPSAGQIADQKTPETVDEGDEPEEADMNEIEEFSQWEFDQFAMRSLRQGENKVDTMREFSLDTHIFTLSCKTFLDLPEANLLEDDDSEDDVPEFAVNAIMASEAFFPFHWSVVSHLDTIGEDAAEEEEELDDDNDEDEGEEEDAQDEELEEDQERTNDAEVIDEAKEFQAEETDMSKDLNEEEKEVEESSVVAVPVPAVDKEISDAPPPTCDADAEEMRAASAAARDAAETGLTAARHVDNPLAELTGSARDGERPRKELLEGVQGAPEDKTAESMEEVTAVGTTWPTASEPAAGSPTAPADTPEDTPAATVEAPQTDLPSANQHEPLSSEAAASAPATDPGQVAEAELAVPSRTASYDTGVQETMDALLALDSLTAEISKKKPPTHGYSHSSLSDTSLSPPPSFSRLPPDGHEFPPNYQEPSHFSVGVPALIEMEIPMDKTSNLCDEPDMKMSSDAPLSPPPLPVTGPPPRKQSSTQDLEFMPSVTRKFSTGSAPSSAEETLRSPVRNLTWRKDEKSERSVRDKIAMFSNAQDGQPSVPPLRRLSKYSSSEDVFYHDDIVDNSSVTLPSVKLLSRSVLSVDKIGQHSAYTGRHSSDPSNNPPQQSNNLYKKSSPTYSSTNDVSSVSSTIGLEASTSPKSLDYTTRTQSYMDLPSSSSSAYSSCSPDSSLSSTASTYTLGYSSTLPRKMNHNKPSGTVANSAFAENNQKQNGAPSLYRRTSFCGSIGTSNLHSRSQSLVDVGAIPSNKRNSIAGYKSSAEDMRKASLNALIEQRRRGISKLRGLVIPEKVSETTTNQAIIDLPEIKSRDSILSSSSQTLNKDDPKTSVRQSIGTTNRWGTSVFTSIDKPATNTNSSSTANLTSLPWKSQTPVANLPKYSPAFKRKSLSLYGVSSSASSVSSSLSSSREELRPLFDNTSKSSPPPLPPMKPPRNASTLASNITKLSVTPCYTTTVTSPLLPHPEPPKSLESITSPTRSDLSFEFLSSNGSSPDLGMTTPTHAKEDMVVLSTKKHGTGKILNGEHYAKNSKGNPIHADKGVLSSDVGRSGDDDSDNDSAVSSSRSSISHGFSPPPSPLPDNTSHQSIGDDNHHSARQHIMMSPLPSAGSVSEKRPLRRTLSSETTASAASSTASTLTSGSQASCSSNGSSGSDSNRRILKAQSVEAINRKNVLSSAKYSSGRDLKVGSPLIQRKFEGDDDGTNESKITDRREENLLRKCNRCDNIEDTKNKNHIKHKDDGLTELGRSHDIVHYRTSSTESMSDGVIKMAYLEVEENKNAEIVTKMCENYSEPQKAVNCTIQAACNENEIEDRESESIPPRHAAPLPAPRHTITPTQVGKALESNDCGKGEKHPTASINTDDDDDDDDDEVFRHEKSKNKNEIKNESGMNSPSNCNTDKQNDNTSQSNKESSNSSEKWPYNSNTDVPSNATSTSKSTWTPVVPPKPKPVQRRSSLKNSDIQGDPSHDTADGSLNDTNLMDILTGRGGKQDHNMIRLRDRQKNKDAELTNRPVSLPVDKDVEGGALLLNGSRKSPNTGEQPISPTATGPSNRMPITSSKNINNRRSVSVNDIKKAFEKAELALASSGRAGNGINTKVSANVIANNHMRVSSLDSTTSEDSMAPALTRYGSASNLHREQYGSITSLASSSTSLISQQELQALIDEANQTIEESGGFSTPVHEVLVVILHRETIGGSVGITLAGGADYEAKEITVHKVLAGSLADRDGRIQKGDRILSINGRSMKNVTHKESLEILKAPRLEVVLVVSRSRGDSALEEVHTSTMRSSSRPPRILEQLTETVSDCQIEETQDDVARGPPVTITLAKDGAGLGFSLEGGKDSPTGDKPLTIKKIFTGGAAEKNGQLKAGDELLVVNGKDVTVMSRIEAWGLMKRLPDGNVTLTVRHKVC